MIRVLEFVNVINRFDFVDSIVRRANADKFEMYVCVRSEDHFIEKPETFDAGRYAVLAGESRLSIAGTAWKLSRLLKKWDIDILHAHHYDQAVIAWLATKLSPKVRLVIGRHYSDALYRLPDKWKSRFFIGLEQIVNRRADRIIVPSRMIFDILTEKQSIASDKIDIVQYGFVPEKYSRPTSDDIEKLRREFGMEGRFAVANFGRLHEEKGHRYLIDAVAQLRESVPNLLVLCVGEGPERANIERQIRTLGVEENVRLVGWRTDAMTIMAAADAVVQSTLQEAFSQVMVEALWMSKPLVITDVSGAPDIIRNGENGLMVPKADADALAAAMSSLADDAELRQRLAASGHAFVAENLVISRKVKDYERAFERAAG